MLSRIVEGRVGDVLLSSLMLSATLAYYVLAAADFLSVIYFIGALVALNTILIIRKQANWMVRIGTVTVLLHVGINCAYMAQSGFDPFILPPLVAMSALIVVLPRLRLRQTWLRYSVATVGPLLCGLALFVFWSIMHLREGFDVYYVDLAVLFVAIGLLSAPGFICRY